MAAELPKPGVEVIQQFRTVSPSVITPTLVPCVVGACRQIVEVLNGSSLNQDAKITLPVFFTAKNASQVGIRYVYTGLNGKDLVLSVNNSPDVTVAFDEDYLTPASVVNMINTALNAAGVFSLIAETKQEYSSTGALMERTWTFRSVGSGELEKVEIRAATSVEVWAAFDLKPGWTYTGEDMYTGNWMRIVPAAFPDPRNNLSELAIDSDSIRIFFATSSTNIKELQRTSAFCRRGAEVYAYDDGNGDALTPFVDMPGEDFTSTATPSGLMGSVVLTTLTLPADLEGMTLTMQGNRASQTYTFVDTTTYPLTSVAEVLEQLNDFFEDFLFEVDGSNYLQITSKDNGQDSYLEVVGGTAPYVLGLTTKVLGTVALNTLTYPDDLELLSVVVNGTTLTFASGQPTGEPDLLSELNDTFTDFDVTANTFHRLVFTRKTVGSVTIGAGTANTVLGLTAATTNLTPTTGSAFPVRSGDELFINGKSYGYINQVAPGGVASRLRLTKQVVMATPAQTQGTVDMVGVSFPAAFHTPDKTFILNGTTYTFSVGGAPADITALLATLSATFSGFTFTATEVGSAKYLKITKISSGPFTLGAGTANAVLGLTAATYHPQLGANFYVVARNLTGSTDRPIPELQIDSGVPVLSHDLLRSTAGVPSTASKSYVYMMYKALRKDVSPAAVKPGLLKFDTTTEVTDALAPLSAENPLALGLYFALLNCPGVQVTGVGVDEVSADMPEGTVESFTRAAEFLEGVEVYSIAPLTHDKTVAEIFSAHVSTMSAPENKGERICFFNTLIPSHELDTLVASGATGNSLGTNIFDTGIPNLSALLLAAGIPNPVGTIDTSYGVFLDVASNSKNYSVESVAGSIVTVRLSFTNGDNDDGFYAQSPDLFPPSGVPLIDEVFAVKIRGAELKLPTGKPDKSGIAVTMQQFGQTFMNRRFWHIVGDRCAASLSGVEQVLEGYYLAAGYAGLVAGNPPQQSFTNFPLNGFTRVYGTNDTFTEKQLNIMAAGGNWIVIQDTQNSPLVSRMALTTDMTSIETRTDSITKVVDFTAKLLRRGYRNFIGRFNVTQGFIDSLGHVGQGILVFLTESGVLIGGSLTNLVQDEASPDTVLVDCVVDPPYPCNYIRITIVL